MDRIKANEIICNMLANKARTLTTNEKYALCEASKFLTSNVYSLSYDAGFKNGNTVGFNDGLESANKY